MTRRDMRSRLLARRGLDVNVRAAPQLREYEAIVSRIARDRPASVLDWGCGHGQMSHLLAGHGLNVTSLDYREDIDEEGPHALVKYPDLTAYLTSDPVALPYPDETFDAVLSCGVLEHVSDPEASLDELRRVLRPGGTLYVYKLPNRRSWLEAVAKRMDLYYHGLLPHDRLYDLASAREIVERHGYAVVEARRANMLPLTLTGRAATSLAGLIWAANRAVARIPLLNRLATNVELVARRPAGA